MVEVHSKFNQIPYYQDGWATNWRIILLKVLPQENITPGSPVWRFGMERESLREFGFEDQWGLIAGASQDSEQPSLLENAHKSHVHQYQKNIPQSPGKAYWRSWRVFWACSGGQLWLILGIRALVAEAWRAFIDMRSPEGQNFGSKTWPHSTDCRLWCWDTSVGNSQQGGNTATPESR